MIGRLAATVRLARWLGPWADPEHAPRGVQVERRATSSGHCDLYRPARPRGVVVLVHGLHFAGQDDPRFHRFARVLAASGLVIVAPELRRYRALEVTPEATRDVLAAFDVADTLVPEGRAPVGLSISFGCLPLVRAVAEREADATAGLVTFGGYGDWESTLWFALRGDGARSHDPLNRPVVFRNLLPHLPHGVDDPGPVVAAWDAYVRSTWGQEAYRTTDAWRSVAREAASELEPGPMRALFEVGVGLADGSAWAEEALGRGDWSHLSVSEPASRVRCPVRILHGRDDDVIPSEQADILASAFTSSPDVRTYVTGAYEHTGNVGGGLAHHARELRTTLGMLHAFAALPRRRVARTTRR